ncbi:indole-3-glycerol phosphate synthase TrpC [Cylindrospermopsis raciborskii]|uniref:Indole-3-glycerol phosphate synthase n=1 Tax=Cylindrospermopsis raciborskii CENA302 TaxID=1170768 RepID=A0A9Q5W9T7_9CYAN|nr:indole-3-glycerol phosphate synthase TrpC [Cylindrospermopsis raciborskii]MCZ2200589.1 indole-3-glycerol phosphate synthase TrpC [Cylindrospermopsis raciborskii PAMP2012]MCZ2206400.1 indole-3-glycerol phosphate synthase TrpC [Cylindrospermopsis raciborskii PAMP2011]NLQ03883.1 indole-3-glycerol-phosphate synthase [Cylindrospermopsis raciborskii MVCC19]OHY33382.1 indole-3-glycerol phosphate synthase [Cylindrospermopsis raciborskii MVCC14]OPH10090.1 indole-3-glycerol phosphate synthase [Cylind
MEPIIREIIWHKKLEIAQIQQEMSLASLQRQLTAAPSVRDFFTALQQNIYKPSLIAEVKRIFSDESMLSSDFDALSIAKSYERTGAACISVVTDQKFFHGGFDQLRIVRHKVTLPILCKDFVLDPCQIYLARAAGADAILLIAAILTDQQINNFLRVIHYLGMNAVIEVHNLMELDRVLRLEDVRIIAINNRRLEDLTVNINTTLELMAVRKSHLHNLGILVVSESGIETSEDLSLMANVGVNGVLIGDCLLREENLEDAVKELLKSQIYGFGSPSYKS